MKTALADNIASGVALLVARHGSIVFKEACGTVSADSTVMIASMTKSAVATGVMLLVDRKKLSLEDPISKHLPEFRGTPMKATIRHLLSHTSGLVEEIKFDPTRTEPTPSGRPPTHGELARRIAHFGSFEEPGDFHYLDRNHDLVCAILEKIGQPVEEFLRVDLFEPLGMRSRFFIPPPDLGHGVCVFCGGGLEASLDDVYALYQMHLDRGTYRGARILSSDAIREMHKKQGSGELPTLGPGTFEYGLGFFRERVLPNGEAQTLYHYGHYGTLAWIDFDSGSVGVLFLDSKFRGDWRAAAKRIQATVRECLLASDTK